MGVEPAEVALEPVVVVVEPDVVVVEPALEKEVPVGVTTVLELDGENPFVEVTVADGELDIAVLNGTVAVEFLWDVIALVVRFVACVVETENVDPQRPQ